MPGALRVSEAASFAAVDGASLTRAGLHRWSNWLLMRASCAAFFKQLAVHGPVPAHTTVCRYADLMRQADHETDKAKTATEQARAQNKAFEAHTKDFKLHSDRHAGLWREAQE